VATYLSTIQITGGPYMQRYYWDPMRELAEAQRQFSAFLGETLR